MPLTAPIRSAVSSSVASGVPNSRSTMSMISRVGQVQSEFHAKICFSFASVAPSRELPQIPLPLDLLDRVFGTRRVQPEYLDRVNASHLHFQPSADGTELEMLFARSNRRNHAQGDLSHMVGIARRLHRGNRAGNHGRMPAVELRPSQQSFNVSHAPPPNTAAAALRGRDKPRRSPRIPQSARLPGRAS